MNAKIPVATPSLAVELGWVQVQGLWHDRVEMPPASWRPRRMARVRWGPVGMLVHPQIWRDEGL